MYKNTTKQNEDSCIYEEYRTKVISMYDMYK